MIPIPSVLRRALTAVAAACAVATQLSAGRAGDLAAALLGALLVAAFAPFSWYPLAVITPMGLLWLTAGLGWRRAAWRGFLFGAAEFGLGTYWIYISVHEVGGAPAPVAMLMLAALTAIMASYSAAVCALLAKLAPQSGWRRMVWLFPALWTLLEWLRSWFLSGFPWLSLGYSQIDGPLRGYAPLLGVFGVSLCVAFSAGLLLTALRPSPHKGLRLVALASLLMLWMLGAWLSDMHWTRPVGAPFQASLVQGNIPQDEKWDPEASTPTLELYRRLTEQHWDSRLIVWPEAAIPEYQDEVQEDYLDPLETEARRHGTDMLVGVPTHDWVTDYYYNSVISLGAHDGVYNKRHLVIFGEFFPVPGWVRNWLRLMDLPYSDFTRGAAEQSPLRVAGYPAGISICFEDAFGDEIFRALPQAAFLVNVSNDGWFGESIALPQHLEIARMRALEAGRYMLRTTNTGITAIVDDSGKVREIAPLAKTYVLSGSVQPLAGGTPLGVWGNAAVVMLSLLLAVAAALYPWRRRAAAHADPAEGSLT
jgi:apolipoprotein N-acyltransferase